MIKIASLLYDSLSKLKDENGLNSYCVRLILPDKIKVYPNPESSRTIISTSALARITALVDESSVFTDINCFVSVYNNMPCVTIYRI